MGQSESKPREPLELTSSKEPSPKSLEKEYDLTPQTQRKIFPWWDMELPKLPIFHTVQKWSPQRMRLERRRFELHGPSPATRRQGLKDNVAKIVWKSFDGQTREIPIMDITEIATGPRVHHERDGWPIKDQLLCTKSATIWTSQSDSMKPDRLGIVFRTVAEMEEWAAAVHILLEISRRGKMTISSKEWSQYSLNFSIQAITGLKLKGPSYISQVLRASEDAWHAVPKFKNKPNLALFTIFDGHGGQNGRKASWFSRNYFAKALSDRKKLESHPERSMTKAFRLTESHLRIHSNIDVEMAGSTATAIMLDGQKIVVGNLGDSRAIVGEEDGDGNIIAIDLTEEHRFDDTLPMFQEERERVKNSGGLLLQQKDVPHMYRAYDERGMAPGIAVSRTLGDGYAKAFCGISPMPAVSTYTMTAKTKFVVVASDGVWEFLESQDVANMVSKHEKAHEACKELCLEAQSKWKEDNPETDDITAIVIIFEHLE